MTVASGHSRKAEILRHSHDRPVLAPGPEPIDFERVDPVLVFAEETPQRHGVLLSADEFDVPERVVQDDESLGKFGDPREQIAQIHSLSALPVNLAVCGHLPHQLRRPVGGRL